MFRHLDRYHVGNTIELSGDFTMKKRWFLSSIRINSRGFTLIELLVVIAILGTIASIAIPNILKFMNEGVEETKDTEHDNVQLVVQVMMLDAKWTQLDDSYDEVQTSSQIETVTTGGGAYSLEDYILKFGGTTDFKQAYDISIDGAVTVD